MPLLAVAAPTLQLGRYFGCPVAFDRKMAMYFIVPFGIAATALGYPQHRNNTIVAGNLGGIASVALAVTWRPMMAYRTVFMLGGCSLMLASQFLGDRLGKEQAAAAGTVKTSG
eukprot:gnl/TRDRNA2_/TRDRNA2_196754_c0_seq1.p2 gnl/TRDRNA2_/TRDRNA2_196754_c0~~gnl/TRDRNA2_/TRDRNA2_196754_c0_seq1.p2  ORF type:complete len:113 (+),score=15.38 gnl/TRDRNA2_/TRDRNA2_196754_c0_seq1:332-670(+)